MKVEGLKKFLQDNSFDAFLMVGESYNTADMFYATRFLAHDPFTYLYDGEEILIISDMELGRARLESRVEEVRSTTSYGFAEKLRRTGNAEAAYCDLLADLLAERNIEGLSVPNSFPSYYSDCLRDTRGYNVTPVKSPLKEFRGVKNQGEIRAIEKTQQAAEDAMGLAINLIKKASIKDGLLFKGKEPLTSEKIKAEVAHRLLDLGCEIDGMIVACGPGSSNPHWEGEGPLKENEPITIDLVPRLKRERYYADMTRTILRGEPTMELEEMYRAVLSAQEAALRTIKAGVTGKDVHDKVVEVLEELGYAAERKEGKELTEGFIHSTGHGVGLDIHEEPSLSETGRELKPGNVVTVEPGLYYRKIGGIRIEDLVLVAREGCKNLTRFEKILRID